MVYGAKSCVVWNWELNPAVLNSGLDFLYLLHVLIEEQSFYISLLYFIFGRPYFSKQIISVNEIQILLTHL